MVWQVEGGYPYPANVYAYDPWGKRVMSGYNPAPIVQGPSQPNYTYTFYGITGQRLATLNCNGSNYPAYPNCTITGQNVYYGKKLIVSGGVPVVTDRLGTVRADTQGEGFAYYPYGEERTATPDGRNKFATYFRDTVGQDYADQRYYGSATGRFWSPDRGRATRGNPTSWNRYAYVNGDPVNRFDPRGREDAAPGDGGCWSDDEGNFICSVDSTATPDGGGGGYYGVILNGDPTDDPTDDGDPDPPDPTPVPDPQQPTKNPSHPCTTGQRNFVSAHLADATAAAGLIGTSALDILALSGYESGWGTGPFIAAQGNYTGNAFFSLEGEIATPTSAPPATLYNSTGWSQPTSQTNADGMYAIMAGYASYYDAAMSFVNYKGGLFANVTDPTAFGKIASSNGYGISVSTFVSIANTLATCLH
jgi:RHS repeat-associated protein